MDQQLIEHEEHITSKEHLLPIAEIFTSIHGEGTWSGTRMTFIRLAGCTVGRRSDDRNVSPFPIFHPSGAVAHICRAWNGVTFTCDTNFSRTEWVSIEQILQRIAQDGTTHVCLTGGEPLAHLSKLKSLAFFTRLKNLRVMIHVETSGTIEFPLAMRDGHVWITVSPKWNARSEMLNMANEIRLLVGAEFDTTHLPAEVFCHDNVFVSPINEIDSLDRDSNIMANCMDLLKSHPNWRISAQMHKVYGWR